jgi:hypothetical protein
MTRGCEVRAQARRSPVSRSRRWTLLLTLVACVVGSVRAEAASLDVSWNAPTTNMDGTALTDLAGYHLYIGTSVPPCPGTSFWPVASSTSAPVSGEAVAYRIASLTAGVTYYTLVSAVDLAGNESPCTTSTSAVARADFSVSPAGAVNLGTTTTGTALDTTFTVQNLTTSSLTGTVSVGSPFSIVSGGTFSLGSGASQTVIVRLLSTVTGSFASNVSFIANGDTLSRSVSGSVVASAGVTLSVTRNGTGTGTVTSTPAGITCGSDCTETVAAGTAMTLTAAAASGSTFAGWSGGGCGTAATCTVTLNATTSVTATFNTSTTTTPSSSTSGEIVIDNAAPGVQDPAGGRTFTGAWCQAKATKEYGANSLVSCGTGGDTYRWTPTIPTTGTYDVYIWMPKRSGRSTTGVPIQVAHASGTTTLLFNERSAAGTWVLHGRYTFNAGTAGYVQTSDVYGVAGADAISFIPVR